MDSEIDVEELTRRKRKLAALLTTDAGPYFTSLFKIVRFAHRNKVKVVVAPEAMGRVSTLLFREAYRRLYPDETVPPAFFVNFKAVESSKQVQTHFPGLARSLKEGRKVMILDNCVHSGSTFQRAERALKPLARNPLLKAAVVNQISPEVKMDVTRFLDFAGTTKSDICSPLSNEHLGFARSRISGRPWGYKERVSKEVSFASRHAIKETVGSMAQWYQLNRRRISRQS
ncbi:hypothetical protein HY546_03465 [archaeon]|nr:hypothetical protein [archaeon]